MRALLYVTACFGVLFLALSVGAVWITLRPEPDMPRRRSGRCAVPGCGRAAGHWKATR